LAVLGLFAFGLLGHGGIVHEIRYRKSDRSPIHLLHRASQAVGQIFAAGMRTNDLTPRQLAVLVAVAENEGLSQADLVERTGVDRSTLADIVKRLKGKGLLQRRRTREDARAFAVKLTKEGHRLLRAAEPLAKRVDERILDALPAKRRAEFMSALASVVAALQKPNST
jgi:DNA-binding MarR family transcriptional regulator